MVSLEGDGAPAQINAQNSVRSSLCEGILPEFLKEIGAGIPDGSPCRQRLDHFRASGREEHCDAATKAEAQNTDPVGLDPFHGSEGGKCGFGISELTIDRRGPAVSVALAEAKEIDPWRSRTHFGQSACFVGNMPPTSSRLDPMPCSIRTAGAEVAPWGRLKAAAMSSSSNISVSPA